MEPQTLVITGVRDQARITRSFDLRPNKSIDFTPGQVAILRVKDQDPAYFAFASAPEDRDLEVLVKQKVGASNVIYDMCVGDQIERAEATERNGIRLIGQPKREREVIVEVGHGRKANQRGSRR